MTVLYLLLSLLAGCGFYLACAHQRLWPQARIRAKAMRTLAWVSTALAGLAAVGAMGVWAGAFSAMTAIMLALVFLPYLDGWLQLRRSRRDVG